MATGAQPADDWTVVLQRQPVRIAEGRPEGGYTDMYEIICCDCGDDPGLDYSEVSPRRQLWGCWAGSGCGNCGRGRGGGGRYGQP